MFPTVVDVQPFEGYRLRVEFSDGVISDVDLSDDLWGPMFEPLQDPQYFRRVVVDEEGGTVVWPNGLDLDPLVLHGDYAPASSARIRIHRTAS